MCFIDWNYNYLVDLVFKNTNGEINSTSPKSLTTSCINQIT